MEKMKDTIYRLDTLNAIDDYFNPNHNTDELPAPLTEFLIAVGVIISLQPSAQPEINCSEIPNNSDTIYRQDAIDALDKEYRCTDRSDDWDGLKTAMLIIENLPSVQSRLNKKRISDLLWNEYRTMSPHLSAEGVVARRYYCKELWKELFGEEETPVWMTW